jgi:cyanophycin synthetase
MRVIETAVYRGPHFYSALPMVRIRLDLGQLELWPSHRIPRFTDRLLVALPGLEGHGCSYQAPGGFVRRLREGTWLGHVVEHVALELQTRPEAEVSRGKTRSVKGEPGVYDILYAYEDEASPGRRPPGARLVDSLLPPDLQGLEGLDGVAAPLPDVWSGRSISRRPAALRRLASRARSARPRGRWSPRRAGAASRCAGWTSTA